MQISRAHEDENIHRFRKLFDAKVKKANRFPITSGTAGQDRTVGADLFISDSVVFALIEFKDLKTDLSSERKKPLRAQLCRQVGARSQVHSYAHFACWRSSNELFLSSYGLAVCLPNVIGLQLKEISYDSESAITEHLANEFIDGLICGNGGVQFEIIEEYINWLASLEGHEDFELELLFIDPLDEQNFGLLPFTSIRALQEWLKELPDRRHTQIHTPIPPPGSSLGI